MKAAMSFGFHVVATLIAIVSSNASVAQEGSISDVDSTIRPSDSVQFSADDSNWRASAPKRSNYRRTPAMIGDFYAGNPSSFQANATLDRLFVFANDLDVPALLPSGSSTLTVTEPGPVGIYA